MKIFPLLCALILKPIRMVIFIKVKMANFSLLTRLTDKRRKVGANLLKKKTDEQMGEQISDQKVFLISIVIGKFDRHNFFLESKYSLMLRMSPQITLPDIDMDVQAEIFSDEKALLRRFLNIIGNYQPHCFLNQNLMQFDL
ncbi:hypothetical protein P9112_001046 [Eukaryota sp. TZLM1-RC]